MSEYKLIYSEEAKADIKEINDWYNLQQKGLGKRVKSDILFVVKAIEKNPFFASVNIPTFVLHLATFFLMLFII